MSRAPGRRPQVEGADRTVTGGGRPPPQALREPEASLRQGLAADGGAALRAQPAPQEPPPRWEVDCSEAGETRRAVAAAGRCPAIGAGGEDRSPPARPLRNHRPTPPSHRRPTLANRCQALPVRPAPGARSDQWRLSGLGGLSPHPSPRPCRYYTAGVERSTMGEGSSGGLWADPGGSGAPAVILRFVALPCSLRLAGAARCIRPLRPSCSPVPPGGGPKWTRPPAGHVGGACPHEAGRGGRHLSSCGRRRW